MKSFKELKWYEYIFLMIGFLFIALTLAAPIFNILWGTLLFYYYIAVDISQIIIEGFQALLKLIGF